MPGSNRVFVSAIFLMLIAACSRADAPVAPEPTNATSKATGMAPAVVPYVLENTEVREITSKSLGRTYQVLVSLPESYQADPAHRFPVLFVADANYGFPLLRSLAARVGDHGAGLEDFVLVGLSYAKGDTPAYSRRRDYTPTVPSDDDYVSDMPGRAPEFGQAGAYRRFIADEVFPLVAANYRVDMKRKIFAGHSYGSLLGTDILLSEPTMFEKYILSSPSLWFDNKVALAKEGAYAREHGDMVAEVFLAVGEYEAVMPGSGDRRYSTTEDLLRDMQLLQKQLESRHYPGLRIQSQVLAGENHLTGNPVAYTRGLQWALPPAE